MPFSGVLHLCILTYLGHNGDKPNQGRSSTPTPSMRNPSRCLAKMAAALVIGGFTYGVALANPAHEIPAERRTAAGLLVLVGACLLPNALIVSAARDAA